MHVRGSPDSSPNIGEFALRTGDWSAALTELTAAFAEGYEAEDEACS